VQLADKLEAKREMVKADWECWKKGPGAVALSLDRKERQNIICPYSWIPGNLLSNV
jgi:hypothetical protein